MVKKRTTIWPYLLVAPAVLIILCVVFVPVINAILMSFQNYDLRRPKEIGFNGVANYMEAFSDPLFWNALWKHDSLGNPRCSDRSDVALDVRWKLRCYQ